MSIEVQNITKTFGTFTALRDVSFQVPTGELVALLGPSGSGKTTLLRIIAGLEVADQGAVLFHGEDATDRSVRNRQIGFVFQHYALFRHMTVFENIAFGLRVRPRTLRPSARDIRTRVSALLQLVQLDWLADRYPAQLSGGQRQRVGLMRALMLDPEALLMDEPLGALDPIIRSRLQAELKQIFQRLRKTVLLVTHDMAESAFLGDEIVLMRDGRIVQRGGLEDLLDRPAEPFVTEFLRAQRPLGGIAGSSPS